MHQSPIDTRSIPMSTEKLLMEVGNLWTGDRESEANDVGEPRGIIFNPHPIPTHPNSSGDGGSCPLTFLHTVSAAKFTNADLHEKLCARKELPLDQPEYSNHPNLKFLTWLPNHDFDRPIILIDINPPLL